MARDQTAGATRRKRPRSGGLRRRLVVAFVLVAAVSAGALAAASYLLVRQARLDGSLSTSAVKAREDLNLAANISYSEGRSFVRAYEQRGTPAIFIFPGHPQIPSSPRLNPAIPPALQGRVHEGQLGYQRVEVGGTAYLIVAGKVPGSAAQLYLFFDEETIQRNLDQLRDTLAAAWLGVVLIAALIGRALARRTLEPVVRASDAAKRMAGGQLDTRLAVRANDEFGKWAAAFNEMADALEAQIAALSAAQARERRFTANVAHELRTPLTALVAEASLLADQVVHLPEQSRRPVELLITDVTRLRTLVDELMEISRLDARSEPVQHRQVDILAIATALVAARGWSDLVLVDGQPLIVATDPRRIERILANLIGNAVEHSGHDVRVRTHADDDYGYVDVADGGPGIAPDHLQHVFERFYKADAARSHGGSGLGLAIALENARLLGGDISVSSDVQRGSVFRLTLPLAYDGLLPAAEAALGDAQAM